MRLGSSWLARWLGRRGTFLLLFAGVYTVVGFAVLTIPGPRFYAGPLLDSRYWGVLWLLAAVVAAMVAVRHRGPDRDWPGFGALLIPPIVWTALYVVSLALWLLTGGAMGQLRAVSGIAVWVLDWATVLLVAGWANPDEPPPGRGR